MSLIKNKTGLSQTGLYKERAPPRRKKLMIFLIKCESKTLEEKVVLHLTSRSIYHISTNSICGEGCIAEQDTARHYLLTDFSDLELLKSQMTSGTYRAIYLGIKPDTHYDFVLSSEDDEFMPKLEAFLVKSMSSFFRPDWDDYFMEIAKVVGRRSNCMKRQVAAVIVKDERIIATGYNGTPRGAKNCNEGGCPRCNGLAQAGSALDECLCNHAEENAVAQAAYHGISIKGASIYCTFSPCLRCTKLLINSGVKEVIYNARYDIDEQSLALLAECKVNARSLK